MIYGGRRKENNLCEPAMLERSITDPAHDFVSPLAYGQTFLIRIVNESGDILSRHDRKLFLKQRLEIGKDDEGARLFVILHR